MSVLLDNLAATIAGGTVLVILAALSLSSQTRGVEAVSSHALRTQIESFGDVVQTDLESLSTPLSLDGSAGAFAFRARLTPHDTTQHLVQYTLLPAGERDGVPVFEVGRTVDGVAEGRSGPLFTAWSVVARAADGAPAVLPSDVASVHVVLHAVAPFRPPGTQSVGARSRWETSVSPIILHHSTF